MSDAPRLRPTPPSTSRRRRGTPESRRSRSASCTGSRRPSPRSGCSGRSPGLGEERDYILELLLAHTTAGLTYDECVGVGYQQLHEDPDAALADIVDRYHRVAEQCDAVVIVGSDYTDVASPSELSMNARIAVNLGAPVVLAVRAKDRTPDDVAHVVELCLAEIAGQHAHTAAVVANRCDPAELTAVAAALQARGAQELRAAGGAAAGRARRWPS